MLSDDSIIARTCEFFNRRDLDAFSELLAENVEFVMAGVTLRGVPAVTDFIALMVQGRPGLRLDPVRVFQGANDTVVSEVRIIDTNSAAPPDDRPLWSGRVSFTAYQKGRISEWRVYHQAVGWELARTTPITVACAEQAALRRVAELIVRNTSLDVVFPIVTAELMRLPGVDHMRVVRFEADESATVIAADGFSPERLRGRRPPTDQRRDGARPGAA